MKEVSSSLDVCGRPASVRREYKPQTAAAGVPFAALLVTPPRPPAPRGIPLQVARMASEASFSQYTTNFLNLLIDQNRIEALENICESFEKSYCTLTDTQVRRAVCVSS